MRAICAWCRADGRPADLEEREPLDDPSETHGLCPRHLTELLAGLPSLSFPGIRLLIVVESGDRSLFEYLSRVMAQIDGVQVILDRRHGDRRRARVPVSQERRQLDRRRHRGAHHAMGCTFIRFGAGTSPLSGPPSFQTDRLDSS